MHAYLYLFFDLVVIHHVLYCSYSNSFMNYYNIPSNAIKQTKTAWGTWASHDELKQVKPLKMIKEILLEILSTFSLSPIDNFNRRNSTFSPVFQLIEIPEIKYDKFLISFASFFPRDYPIHLCCYYHEPVFNCTH